MIFRKEYPDTHLGVSAGSFLICVWYGEDTCQQRPQGASLRLEAVHDEVHVDATIWASGVLKPTVEDGPSDAREGNVEELTT